MIVDAAVAQALGSLLAGKATIDVRRHGFLRRWARSARAGRAAGVDLVVRDTNAALAPFTVALPDEPDLLAPPLAEAITAAIDIRTRFGAAIAGLRTISFDQSDSGMVSGHMAGNAQLNLSTIHLNANYVTARGVDHEEQRLGHAVVSMAVLVAHELWHLIELGWEVRDYRSTVAFRRELGTYFGVETIEHAIRSDGRANEQLRTEVSNYAAKSPKEATAEMFEQWWLGRRDSAAVTRFGELVERYLPR